MYRTLSYWQVGLAGALILVNGLISTALSLGLGRQLLLAALRMVAQLVFIGYVLRWVFAQSGWLPVVAIMAVMTLIASVSAVQRTERHYGGIWLDGFAAIAGGAWTMIAFALFAVVRVEPWYQPQYAIPLLGMILGNTLTGVSLGLSRFADEVENGRDRIEAMLALGATRWEAAKPTVQKAVRTGMVPTVNAMVVAGVVSLPGMMTGQLLSGIDPVQAVRYQIVIMFLIASGTSLGTVGAVLCGYFRLLSPEHQLRLGRLRPPRTRGRRGRV